MDFSEGGYWLYAMISPEKDEYWSRTDYIKIELMQYWECLDGFCDEDGKLNLDLPRATCKVSFEEENGTTTVNTHLQYASLIDLETVIKMGMEEGIKSHLNQLDNLINKLNMKDSIIKIECTIEAPSNKVWEYYNTPSHIVNWNFAIPEWHCPSAENNLKIGGNLKTRMEARDGSMGFDFVGIYQNILLNEMLSYNLEDGRNVTITFQDIDENTLVKISFEAEKENPIEMQKGGWQSILNNFKKYVESM